MFDISRRENFLAACIGVSLAYCACYVLDEVFQYEVLSLSPEVKHNSFILAVLNAALASVRLFPPSGR